MVLAYQSVKVGRAKMKFGFKPSLKDLFCWFMYYHAWFTLKITMPKLTFKSVVACCIICIIVLLERKVWGEAQERKGRTIGKLRESVLNLLLNPLNYI